MINIHFLSLIYYIYLLEDMFTYFLLSSFRCFTSWWFASYWLGFSWGKKFPLTFLPVTYLSLVYFLISLYITVLPVEFYNFSQLYTLYATRFLSSGLYSCNSGVSSPGCVHWGLSELLRCDILKLSLALVICSYITNTSISHRFPSLLPCIPSGSSIIWWYYFQTVCDSR